MGLGAVGSLVADTAIKLGMKVAGFDSEITVDAAWRLPSSVRRAHTIEELLKHSDFVTLHVPLLPVTRHLIDEKRLQALKPGASLLNFARDAIVDESAVVVALRAHRLKYYLCDFPSARLIGEPGVVALPHLGASTEEAEENCAIMVVDQVREFLENGTISNAVNFPSVEMLRESPYRVAIANANVPNMVGQISTTMARAGLNIHNMVNKSRGEMAYTLVDVDSPIEPAVIEAISSHRGRAFRARDPGGSVELAGIPWTVRVCTARTLDFESRLDGICPPRPTGSKANCGQARMRRRQARGCQTCGRSESMSLALVTGSRVSTSRR